METNRHTLPDNADDLIRELYQEKVGIKSCVDMNHPVRDLANKLAVPTWKISRRAIHLGVSVKNKKEPNWSTKELEILERNARFVPETIQRKLKESGYNRSITGIVLKRKRMRLPKNLNGQPINTLKLCFGVDAKVIARWVKKGYLKAEKRDSNRTAAQGGDMYYIKDKWVRDFIINYVDIIDFRKLDKHWCVDLLAGGRNGTGPSDEQ